MKTKIDTKILIKVYEDILTKSNNGFFKDMKMNDRYDYIYKKYYKHLKQWISYIWEHSIIENDKTEDTIIFIIERCILYIRKNLGLRNSVQMIDGALKESSIFINKNYPEENIIQKELLQSALFVNPFNFDLRSLFYRGTVI